MQLQLAKQPRSKELFYTKIQIGRIEGIPFGRKYHGIFNKFVALPLEILDKAKPDSLKFHKIVLQKHVAPLKFHDQNARHKFFLILEFLLVFFYLISGNLTCYFLIPLQIEYPNSPVSFFSRTAQMNATNNQQLSIKNSIKDY